MKEKIILGLALALSVIHPADAPTKSLSRIEKMVSEMKTGYIYHNESEKVKELVNYYQQQIEDEKKYVTDDFTRDKDEVLLARMIMGEVAKRPRYEKLEIGSTAITRMSWGLTLKEVILFPRAYSCFNEDSNRLDELKHPFDYGKTEFLNCLEVSKELLQMKYKSLGATHYYNPKIVKKPDWAKKMKFVGKVGPHLMYK